MHIIVMVFLLTYSLGEIRTRVGCYSGGCCDLCPPLADIGAFGEMESGQGGSIGERRKSWSPVPIKNK
jgi:hypothetical protein